MPTHKIFIIEDDVTAAAVLFQDILGIQFIIYNLLMETELCWLMNVDDILASIGARYEQVCRRIYFVGTATQRLLLHVRMRLLSLHNYPLSEFTFTRTVTCKFMKAVLSFRFIVSCDKHLGHSLCSPINNNIVAQMLHCKQKL